MTVLVRDFEEIAHMRFQVSESIGIGIVTMDHEAFEIMERCRLIVIDGTTEVKRTWVDPEDFSEGARAFAENRPTRFSPPSP